MLSNDILETNTANEDFLNYALQDNFEDLHFKFDHASGMIAIIAIHSTKLGPALGGCRFIHYPNTRLAIFDAMRLARGMSYKAALVNLELGGGKSVVIEPPTPYDRVAYMRTFGKFVQQLNGRYITALDSGTNLADMDIIGQETNYVASLSKYNGDPAPYTAKGVLRGIEAAVAFRLKRDSVAGLHFAIQGLGHVGYELARLLYERGAKLTVTDILPENIERAVNAFNATAVATHDIYQVKCDVFAPCALGGIINAQTTEQLQAKVVAGAANNQLAHASIAKRLADREILYATDYVINAGGLIYAASKYFNTPVDAVNQQIDGIYHTMLNIFESAATLNMATAEVSDKIAQEKLGLGVM